MFAERTNWDLSGNRLSQALAEHRSSGKPLIDLTASNPTECEFRYDRQAIEQGLCNSHVLQYQPDPRGLESARRTVARYYVDRGSDVLVDDIFLTTGTSEAYSFVFRILCNPGDEILVPAPSYPLFDFLADIQDVRLIRYPLLYDHGWQIDFHALERAVTPRTRAIIVVHPNNPTGHFTKPAEVERLSEICASRQIALIADEVFLDFALGVKQFESFVASKDVLTFALSGLSKIAGLPQMKFAWVVVNGPAGLKKEALARLEMIADTYLSMNAPVQLAASVLFEQRHAFQKQLIERARNNLASLDRLLGAQKSCSRLEIEGGWYSVLRVPATGSDEDVAIELLAAKDVYVHPGHFYDFPTEGYLVLSLIVPEEQFARGAGQLLSAF